LLVVATSTASSVLHDPQEVMTGHEEVPRLANVTSSVPFLHSQVAQGVMQPPLTPLTSSQQHIEAHFTLRSSQWQPQDQMCL